MLPTFIHHSDYSLEYVEQGGAHLRLLDATNSRDQLTSSIADF